MREQMSAVSDTVRILHVDGEPDLADLAATFPEREDTRFSVDTAVSVTEGLAYLAENEVDCIISDYDMPGQNGIEFLETVRETRPELPFILYTGKGSEEIASEAISAGVTDYLQKEGGTDQRTILATRIADAVEQFRSRKEVEQQLQETTSRLEALFDQSPDMINIHDLDGNITDPNTRFCEKTGYDGSELTGMKVWEIDQAINPDEAERFWTGMERGDQKRIAGVYRRKDGSTFPVEVHVRRFNLAGEDRFMVISRDISDRKARERTLQQERDRFRAVFKESFDAMVIADDDGQYTDANESATELFGLSKEELLGRSISEFAPSDFDFERAWKAFQRSDNERGIFPLVRPDGTELRVEYAATMNITPGRHLSVLRDVTERETRERELERHNERLEEFTSIVSHDLRNPLNVAQGRLELAGEECESEHLAAIGRAHERMEALITDLLTLAREGDTATDITTVDLAAVTDECWQNVETNNATLVIDVDRTIRADESRLAQLFENLIRNAVEHGGDTATVTVGELDDGFYVEDDGPGIPADERSGVFDAGYSTSTSGTGFGLSIVKQIVEAHDWSITVTEGADGGARFEIPGIQFATG